MNFLNTNPLSSFYEKQKAEIQHAGLPSDKQFKEYNKHNLRLPDIWYNALAVLELALDAGITSTETEDFFNLIFKAYDHRASVGLSESDYDWYWTKIHQLIDRMAETYPHAYMEKGLQYYAARRGYTDKKRTLACFEQGWKAGDEECGTLLGYYLHYGFCGTTDKEKAKKLLDAPLTDMGKRREMIYKAYISLESGSTEEAWRLLGEAARDNPYPGLERQILEQKGYLLEVEQKFDEAAACYEQAYEYTLSAGYPLLRLGIMHYNKWLKENKSEREALAMIEEAFECGRTEAARSLYLCLFDSETEWQDNERGVEWLHKGALYCDDYCTAETAYLYLYNEAYKDIEKGLHYLDLAIDMDYSGAMVTKAYHYFEGDILEKDIPKSLELLDRAIGLNNGNAAYRAGLLYKNGDVTPDGQPDYATAIAYYEKGAAMENPSCLVELAILYEDGDGVEADPVKSFELARQATRQDYAHALYMLGRCYKYAIGTEENPDEAIACFEKAAGQGHPKAMAELGYIYEIGYGVEADGRKALEYMEKAAASEYPYAQYRAGYYYLYGIDGVTEDYTKAKEWLEKAAANDYPHAMLELGNYYLYDYGEEDMQDKAFAYYLKAAGQEIVSEGLGLCFEHGFGVEQNEGEAFKYYLKAAEDGYIRGQYNAGMCYYYGFGVKENASEAFRWFNESAAYDHAGSQYYKGKMLLDGEGVEQNIDEGVELLRKAAEADERNAQFELGNCYLVGKGVIENEDLAMEWFEKAADNGHEQALKLTGRRRRK